MQQINNKKSFANVVVSLSFKIIYLIGSIVVKRCLIRFVGNDINGINSLYLSIIGVLSVAELGIGDAIIFCMYKPIVEGCTEKVAALYSLFQRIYRVIALIIAIAGCAVMPFLPQLAKGYSTSGMNLYITFGLMLISVVLSYVFSANTSLMNAYRDNYITTSITSGGQLLQQAMQVAVLFRTRSFEGYLCCRIAAVLLQWGITEVVVRRKYPQILWKRGSRIDSDTKSNIVRNIKATFMHKIGGVLVNTIDSIIISAFIGVTILGKYSNYTTIMTAMMGILTLFFSPLTSTIGHLFVQDRDSCGKYYHFFYTVNYILGCIFFLGYYSVIDDLILLLFGDGLKLSRSISFIITVNYFVQFMRQSTLTFREATGTFYYDRWKPLLEGLSNLVLSIAFVKLFQRIAGDDFAVVGVIVATIITNIFICHIVEPYVLHKYAFHVSVKGYYLRNYIYIVAFVVVLLLLNHCIVILNNKWVQLIVNGCIAVGLSLPLAGMAVAADKNFRHFVVKLFNKYKR